MISDLIRYKRASQAFRARAISRHGVNIIGDDCPEWDALEQAWNRLVAGRPRLESFLSKPKVYLWIS